MKIIIAILIISAIVCFIACKGKKDKTNIAEYLGKAKSIYSFKVKNINDEEFDFSTLKGKKIMIVNVASKCGLTPQYEGLQKLYETYKNKNFTIIAFPANNFLRQEPGTNSEIKTFCSINYGVEFPIMDKIDVKGKGIHPIYQYLTQKKLNGFSDNKVKWNFQKYLINEQGFLEKVISPKTKPMSTEVLEWLK